MEMKIKTMGIAALLLLVVCIAPVAMAEENLTNETNSTNLTESDINEISDFDVLPGAELRFLQLQRAISRNILIGTTVIEVIEKNHPEANVTKLTVILDDMEGVLNETVEFNLSGVEPLEAAKKYVELKKHSLNLTREFRNEAINFLNSTDRQEIRESLNGVNGSLSGIDNMIRNMRRELNAQRVNHTFACMNATNPELERLMERIRDGNITLNEIRETIRSNFQNLSYEEKINSTLGVRSCAVKRVQVRQEVRNEIASELPEALRNRVQETIRNRINKMEEQLEKFRNRLETQNRIMQKLQTNMAVAQGNMSMWMEQARERMENWDERMEAWKEQVQVRAVRGR